MCLMLGRLRRDLYRDESCFHCLDFLFEGLCLFVRECGWCLECRGMLWSHGART